MIGLSNDVRFRGYNLVFRFATSTTSTRRSIFVQEKVEGELELLGFTLLFLCGFLSVDKLNFICYFVEEI
jgi:hypothetical protein